MKTDDPRFELIRQCRDGQATAAEFSQLELLLRADPLFRDEYVRYVNMEVALGTAVAMQPLDFSNLKSRATVQTSRWFEWRPIWAAAAGIVFGILCTSVVFAYVAPLAEKAVYLLQDSFETGPRPLVTGMPIEAGHWSGDYTEVVGEQQGVKPASGNKMLRFLRADYEGKANADGYVADLYRLIDLRPYQGEFADGGAVVQFSAGYNAFEFPANEGYGCLMSLHTLDAEMVKNGALSDRQILNSDALAMTSSSRLLLDRNPATWQRQTAELRLSPNTEFLLIRVGVVHATKAQQRVDFDGHYLDDVRLVLTRRAPLP